MLIDMIISSFFDVIGSLVSQWGITLFTVLLAVIFGTGQYLLLGFVKQVSKDLRKKKVDIAVTYRIVIVVQYVVSAILILVVLQIILGSYYSAKLIIAATLVSYIPATIIMGILSYRFYSWYKSNRNTISLLFFIGTAMVCIYQSVGVPINCYYIWSKKPIDIDEQSQVNFPKITPQSAWDIEFYLSLCNLYSIEFGLSLCMGRVRSTLTLLLTYVR
jgi:hypothetical protein